MMNLKFSEVQIQIITYDEQIRMQTVLLTL